MINSKDPQSLLTATERDRLTNRIPDQELPDADKEKHKNSIYHNDMVVRNKVESWLKKSEDILFALENLPTRKLKKEIDDEDVYKLFSVALVLLHVLDFAPIEDLGGVPVVAKPIASENGKNKNEILARRATEKDFERNYNLKLIKEELEPMISTSDLFKQDRFKRDIKDVPETERWKFFDSYDQKKQYYEATISAADKTIAEDSANAQAWLDKGFALFVLEKYEAALESVDKAINLSSIDLTLGHSIRTKCIILEHLGRYAESEETKRLYSRKLAESKITAPENFASKGYYHFLKYQYKQAIECYDEAIRLDPSNPVFWAVKGHVMFALGEFEKAMQCFDKAIGLKPSDLSGLYFDKAWALRRLGRDDEATRYFQKADSLRVDCTPSRGQRVKQSYM